MLVVVRPVQTSARYISWQPLPAAALASHAALSRPPGILTLTESLYRRASLHQSRPVRVGHEKWTMTMWMHQRFTSESQVYADELGYSRELAELVAQS